MSSSEEEQCARVYRAGGVSDQGILLTYALLFSKAFRMEVKFQGYWRLMMGSKS